MKRARPICGILGCLGLLITASVAVRAQSIVTGAVSGTTTDPSGAVVANATVTLDNVDTGTSVQPALTNASGDFLFPLLKPGNYLVSVSMAGFRTAASKVEVHVGNTSTVNLKLEIGPSSQTVEVTGAVQGVQSEDANISTDMNLSVVQNVPNPGGDLSFYAQLAPGVTMATASGEGYGNFSAYGLPATSNLFTIDGDDYNDPFLNNINTGSSNLLLGSNDIADVEVVVNGYTGQYGRQVGAQVDYTTRPGTNGFHGNAIYNWNGTPLNANDFFQNAAGQSRPFMNNNAWAASLGGPIKKNKAFFFVDTEGIRYVFGTSSEVFLPTADLESYTLGNISSADVPFYEKIFALYNGAPGAARATPVDDSCGSLGDIPASGSGGTTTDCLKNFATSGSNGNKEWMLIARADFDLTGKDKFFLRAKIDRGVQPTYTDPIDNSAFGILSSQPQYDGQLNYTHIFNSNIVNSFIGSLLYYSAFFNAANESKSLGVFPDILYSGDTSLFPLGIGSNVDGEALSDAPYPSGRNVLQWQLVDDISFQHGAHEFKMGVNFRRDDISDYTASEGAYPVINSSLADFASGIADTASMEFAENAGQPLAFSSLGFYFQDALRVNSRLKLTLAMRLEPGSAGTCQDSCVARTPDGFNESAHDPTGDLLPLNQLEVTGIKQILPSVNKVVVEPRIGVAWAPFDRNTVLRGGVGLFADLYPGDILDDFTRNSPEVNEFSVSGTSISTAEPNNAQAVLTACNTAYNHAFSSGGTFDSYLDSDITLGSMTETASAAGCETPVLFDAVSPLQAPKYLEWNLELQHAFGSGTTLSIDYVGNHGWDEIVINPYLNSFYQPGTFESVPSFGDLPPAPPDARVTDVLQITNQGRSNYDGLTVSLQKRLWHGLQGAVNYTYGHSLDDLSNGLFEAFSFSDSLDYQIDPYNLQKYNYSSSDYDARHTLNAYFVWDLPFKSRSAWLNRVVSGWTISETFFARTGFPFSLTDGDTGFFLFADATNLDFNTSLAQPISKIPSSCTSIDPNAPCYTSSEFNSSPTTFATVPRNSYRGPGFFNTDLTVHKTFRITERAAFTFEATAYNVLNHVNFANPGNDLAGSTLGYSDATVSSPTSPYGAFAEADTDMRIVQLTGKLAF
ncbi:MAG: carboxypeptidase regulatory-like domain-containing protein [Candidatus Acidiferrales bacterium]